MQYAVTIPEQRFYLHDGPPITTMNELLDTLGQMSDEQFSHHVNTEKHDFAAWVRDVFGDRFLAQQMEKAKTRDQLRKVVFIATYR